MVTRKGRIIFLQKTNGVVTSLKHQTNKAGHDTREHYGAWSQHSTFDQL